MLQPRQRVIDGRRGVLGAVGGANQPGGVAAHKGTKDRGHGSSVGGGVLGDAFQGVETTEPHIGLVGPQVVDGTREPLGDLPFPAHLDLSPGRNDAQDKQRPSSALQQRRSGIVAHSILGLLQLDALFGRHLLQFSRRQRRIQQPWDDQTKDHEHQQRNRRRQQPTTQPPHSRQPPPGVTGTSADGCAIRPCRLPILAFGMKWVDRARAGSILDLKLPRIRGCPRVPSLRGP